MKTSLLLVLTFLFNLNVFASADLRKGEIVYGHNGNDLIGRVSRIFGTKAEVNWTMSNGSMINETSFWECSKLFRQVECSGMICATDEVYGSNGNDLLGTVLRVFENGKAEVNWTSSNGTRINETTYWDVSKLLKETYTCSECE